MPAISSNGQQAVKNKNGSYDISNTSNSSGGGSPSAAAQAAPSSFEQLMAILSAMPAAPSFGSSVGMPSVPQLAAFNPNVNYDQLLGQARTILAPTGTQQKQGYEQSLTQAKAAYDQLLADIGNQYGTSVDALKQALTQQYQDNTNDTNRRGMYWSGVLNAMNSKSQKNEMQQEGQLATQKQYQEGSAARQYNAQETNLQSLLSQLPGLMEQQAASLASSDLYNQEYNRQKDVWSSNNQVANQQYQMNYNNAQLKQAMQNANAQLSQSAYNNRMDNAFKTLQMDNSNYWNQQQLAAQYDPTDKLMAQDVALSQYKQQLGSAMAPYLTMDQPRKQSDVTDWQNNYNQLQSSISAMPSFAQPAVTQYLQSTPWYQSYQQSQQWQPTKGWLQQAWDNLNTPSSSSDGMRWSQLF